MLKDPAERLMNRSEKQGECLIWTGYTAKNGYGYMSYKGARTETHRVAWMVATGNEIPDGIEIDHRCFNRGCINPQHLRPATKQQNAMNFNHLKASNKTGHRNVYRASRSGKYVAQIRINGKQTYLGTYENPEDAAEAARQARLKHHTYNDRDRLEALNEHAERLGAGSTAI